MDEDRARDEGILVTAVSPKAFSKVLGIMRRKGTISLCGLSPSDFPNKDLRKAIAFAAEGLVKPSVTLEPLEAINSVLERLKSGKVDRRIVLTM